MICLCYLWIMIIKETILILLNKNSQIIEQIYVNNIYTLIFFITAYLQILCKRNAIYIFCNIGVGKWVYKNVHFFINMIFVWNGSISWVRQKGWFCFNFKDSVAFIGVEKNAINILSIKSWRRYQVICRKG